MSCMGGGPPLEEVGELGAMPEWSPRGSEGNPRPVRFQISFFNSTFLGFQRAAGFRPYAAVHRFDRRAAAERAPPGRAVAQMAVSVGP